MPVAEPLFDEEGPVRTDLGHATFWNHIVGRQGQEADLPVVGHLLRQLHQLPAPDWVRSWEPLRKVPGRIQHAEEAGVLERADLKVLIDQFDSLQSQVSRSANSTSVITHGDAHEGNLLIAADGPHLLDWEDASLGPPEFDFAEVLVGADRFGLEPSIVDDFFAQYDNSLDESLFPLMSAIKELTATSWLSQNAAVSPTIAREVHLRIRSIAGDIYHRWVTF